MVEVAAMRMIFVLPRDVTFGIQSTVHLEAEEQTSLYTLRGLSIDW